MDAEVRTDRAGEFAVQRIVQRYPLEPGLWITLTPQDDSWCLSVESSGAEFVHGADALTHLLRYQQVPPVERFQLVRHVPAPEASGERPVDDDGQVVVVGERVVVAWNRVLHDVPYTHGLLIWTTPSGHEAPVAVVTRYLPRAVDGRQVLTTLLERDPAAEAIETPALTARMGRITAALHVALATRSRVLAEPIRRAEPDDLLSWHHRVQAMLAHAALIAAEGAAPNAARGYRETLSRLETSADVLAQAARSAGNERPVLLQRVHGDLHVGRILRWAGGLMITGFGDEPYSDPALLGPQPASRDLARLLQSLTTVAREVDDRKGNDRCTAEWLPDARRRLLTAYRTELGVAGRPELFDERLLPAFEAEHTALEIIAAARRTAAEVAFRDSLPTWGD
jgi:maltokinase